MKRKVKPKRRSPEAKALGDKLFRHKVVPKGTVYKRKPRNQKGAQEWNP